MSPKKEASAPGQSAEPEYLTDQSGTKIEDEVLNEITGEDGANPTYPPFL
ncbi:hypothetical protein GCM10009554_42680 [Kribbella koreensis]|uniref:Albusnodin family lasso peptide n=2 Tax=Kribbella TaxID=182639 RepID=A0ABP6VLY7_9ACTN